VQKLIVLILRRHTLVATALSLGLSIFTTPSNASFAETTSVAQPAVKYRAKARFWVDKAAGYTVAHPSLENDPRFSGALVSIDNVVILGKSSKQIDDMFNSDTDKKCVIGYIDQSGKIATVTVDRTRMYVTSKDRKNEIEWLQSCPQIFEGFAIEEWPYVHYDNVDKFNSNNMDIFARAAIDVNLSNIDALPMSPASKYTSLVRETIESDTIGDTATADACIKRILESKDYYPSDKRPYMRDHTDAFIEHLFTTGRLSACKTLCKRLLEWSKDPYEQELRRSDIDPLKYTTLRIYADILRQENNKGEARKAADELFAASENMRQIFDEDKFAWLGDFYGKLGHYDKAIECYEKLYPLEGLTSQPAGKMNIFNVQRFAAFALRIARAQDKLKKPTAAIQTLRKTLAAYKLQAIDGREIACEHLTSQYPTISDIETELANLYYKTGDLKSALQYSQDALKSVEAALPKNSFRLKGPLEAQLQIYEKQQDNAQIEATKLRLGQLETPAPPETTEAEKYALVKQIYDAVEQKDYERSRELAKKLLDAYIQEPNTERFEIPRLNIYTVLVSVARKLADHKRFADARSVLIELKAAAQNKEPSPIADQLMTVEEALIAEAEKKDAAPLWAMIQKSNDLRELGMIYNDGNEPARARVLLNRALEHPRLPEKPNEASSTIALLKSRALTLVELAISDLKLGDLKSSIANYNSAVSDFQAIYSSKAPPDQIDDTERIFQYRALRLANKYASSGHLPEAATVLTKALKPTTQTSTDLILAVDKDKNNQKLSNRLAVRAALHAYLSKIQLNLNEVSQAHSTIKLAIDERRDYVLDSYWLLSAEIAVAAKDNALAAHSFSEAEKTIDQMVTHEHQDKFRESLLQKAIYHAKLAQNFDPGELAAIYLSLGERLNSLLQQAAAIQAYNESNKLVPKSDGGKPELLSRIANLQTAVEENKQTKSSRIEKLLEAAQLAEAKEKNNAFQFWYSLAEDEIEAGMTQRALEHYAKGLEGERAYDQTFQFRCILPSNGKFVTLLVKQGKQADAEALLRKKLNKLQSLYGRESAHAVNQMVELMRFYIARNRDIDASNTLDAILQIGPQKLDYGYQPWSALDKLYDTIVQLAKERRSDLAWTLSNRLLSAQQKVYDSDDIRIADAFINQGKIYAATGNNAEAERKFLDALAIKKLYSGERVARKEMIGNFVPVLKKLGKTAEIEALKDPGDPALSEKEDQRQHESYKKVQKAQTTEEKIQLLQVEYAYQRQIAPYGLRTTQILEDLIGHSETQKDWKTLKFAASERVRIFEHHSDPFAGKHMGCVAPRFGRIKFYKLAAQASYQLDDKAEAEKFVERANKKVVDISTRELLELAQVEDEFGNKSKAIQFADRATAAVSEDIYVCMQLAALWKKLGNQEKADQLEKRYADYLATLKKQSEEASKSRVHGHIPVSQ